MSTDINKDFRDLKLVCEHFHEVSTGLNNSLNHPDEIDKFNYKEGTSFYRKDCDVERFFDGAAIRSGHCPICEKENIVFSFHQNKFHTVQLESFRPFEIKQTWRK